MSKQDYYNLMSGLTNMNVISITDVVSQHVKPIIPGVVVMSVSQEDSGRGFGRFSQAKVQGHLFKN